MPRYIVEYTLPHDHVVHVGITARTESGARAKAQAAFDAGDLWDDTHAMPLLMDDFLEDGNAGAPLQFDVIQALSKDDQWPAPSLAVRERKDYDTAVQACKLLVDAYTRGEARGGSVDWDDVQIAYERALLVIGSPETEDEAP